jgi:hypothetical protein
MKKINPLISAVLLSLILISGCRNSQVKRIDLSGTWNYRIDSLDSGITEQWFAQNFREKLVLPGSLTSNGLGNEVTLHTKWMGQVVDSSYYNDPEYKIYRQPGNIKIPFWLQPVKYYQGAAWYQKKVRIPPSWKNKQIVLFLERCHWESRLWIDNKEIGMQNSLGTPHRYVIKDALSPGVHTISICMDNRVKKIDPGVNSHSISDHTQTNWNGMVGQLYLEARDLVNIQSVKIFPDIRNKIIEVHYVLINGTGKPAEAQLSLQIRNTPGKAGISNSVKLQPGINRYLTTLHVGDDIKRWDEFSPEIYTLESLLEDKATGMADSVFSSFGMRSFEAKNGRIEVNNKPVFLRGTLECAIFPKTGYPSMDVDAWRRIFSICRQHGLNHMRFHSWCPPEAAFTAADREGFYLHVECSSWANSTTSLGDSLPIDQYIYDESERMVESYGNHPSFCMLAYGNEPAGKNLETFLAKFVTYWKEKDGRRIYTAGAGWPNLPENDYLSDPWPRIQHWEEGLASIINANPPTSDYSWYDYTSQFPQPVVSHEIGQWCVYPDFDEIKKYNKVLKAHNFEIFRSSLAKHGLASLADSFVKASGKLQVLCYKADIEAALRTRNFGGFQLLDLHDFPGQGTALVGILNPFWDEKGYVTPNEFRAFCNSVVPLARISKFTWTNRETFKAAIELANYGPAAMNKESVVWRISDVSGNVLTSDRFLPIDFPSGDLHNVGIINYPLNSVGNAKKLILEVSAGNFTNRWDFWVYPAFRDQVENDHSLRIVQELSDETIKFLQQGGSVLLNIKKGKLNPDMGGNIAVGFSSIFWNTAWTNGQAPHTLGILCDPGHPALAEFPTEYYSNWQWWDAMSHAGAINIGKLPVTVEPIVRIIDDWFTNRSLALIFEARVGSGKILISGADLTKDLGKRPEAQQLLYSLKKYMTGSSFNPEQKLDIGQIKRLLQ